MNARLPRHFVINDHMVVTTGQYVRGIRKAKANPTARFPYGLTCWWPCTGAEIMSQFREGMHDRINQRPNVKG